MLQRRVFLRPRPPPPRVIAGFTGTSLLVALLWSTEAHADDQARHKSIAPDEVTVTAGALFPSFLIYENIVPWAGAEVAWRAGAQMKWVANAGMSMVWVDGSQRFLHPIGMSWRVFPWERIGPWIQLGVGAIPYIERISVALPERIATTTDVGATVTAKLQFGLRIVNFEIGVGADFNLLPTPFYSKYSGTETLPWDDTLMVWIGWHAWSKGNAHSKRKP